jgi:hypothetical protein
MYPLPAQAYMKQRRPMDVIRSSIDRLKIIIAMLADFTNCIFDHNSLGFIKSHGGVFQFHLFIFNQLLLAGMAGVP